MTSPFDMIATSDASPARSTPIIKVSAIPHELRSLDHWVVWKYRTRSGKSTKVPFQSLLPGSEAKTDDPSTWSTFERALAVAMVPSNKIDGIGFVFSTDDPFAGFDLDRCFGEGGILQPWARDILDRVPGYAEISPSGKGVKLFVRAACPGGRGRKRLGLSPDSTGVVEVYSQTRFFTVTGRTLRPDHAEIGPSCPSFAQVHAEIFPPKPDRIRVDPAPSSMEDGELIRRAIGAKNGSKLADLWSGLWQPHFGSASEADLSLCSLLAFWTQDPAAIDRLFRQSGMVDTKWTDRADYRELTIGKALERTTTHTPGYSTNNQEKPGENTNNCKNSKEESDSCNSRYSWNDTGERSAGACGTADNPPWPFPQLDISEPASPFPLQCLPGPLADLVSVAATSLGCPVDFPALASLAVACGAMGRSVALRVKDGWVEVPAIYGALVGEPGMTKSPAVGLMAAPLWKITREQLEVHRREVEQAKRFKAAETAVPAPKRIVVDDATTERLAGLLMENPRGLVMVRDELSALFAGLNQYKAGGKGADRQFYLSAWSGSALSVDRKHATELGPVHISHPFLSIVGGMTPSMLSELGEAKGRDDGFLDRILFTCPEPIPVRWTDAGVPPELSLDWEMAIRRLWGASMSTAIDGKPRPWFVRFTDLAREGYAAWFDDHNQEAEGDGFPTYLRGPWAKMRAYCARLALALDRLALAFDPEGLEEPSDVGEASLSRAIVLMTYFKAHTRRVRSMMRGSFGECPDARKVLKWARNTNREKFSAADVRHNFRKLFPPEGSELEVALQWLESRHCIRSIPLPPKVGAGRPKSTEYEVNPALLGDMTDDD